MSKTPRPSSKLALAMGDGVSRDLRDYLLAVVRNPLEKPSRNEDTRREQRALAERLMRRVIDGEIGLEEITFTRLVFAAMLSASTADYRGEEDRTKRSRAIYRATGLDGHRQSKLDELANAKRWLSELANEHKLLAEAFKIEGQIRNALQQTTPENQETERRKVSKPSDPRVLPLVDLITNLRGDVTVHEVADAPAIKRQMRRKRR